MPPLLELNQFHHHYGQQEALKGVSLTLRRGEKVALIGPSGAGKTTLLQTLFQRAQSPKAFVPQAQALVSRLSLFHNVYMGGLDHHSFWYNLLNLVWPQEVEKRRMRPILRSLGMEQRLFDPIGTFSGGEQQRAAIARALFRPAELLLADEPVSSLDPQRAEEVVELLFQQKETVILSLHSVELALAKAQRVIALKAGKIFFDRAAGFVSKQVLKELYQR